MKHIELPELLAQVKVGKPVEVSTEDEVLKKVIGANSNKMLVVASRHDELLKHRSRGSNLLDSITMFSDVMKGHVGIRPPINVGQFVRAYTKHLKSYGIEVCVFVDRASMIEELTDIMALHDRSSYELLRVQARVWVVALANELSKNFNVIEGLRPVYT